MFAEREARRLVAALREAGERISIEIDGVTYSKRAIVQNAGKNFMRKYDDEFNNKRDLGCNLRRDKIAFIPYFARWDDYHGKVIVCYRKKRFVVVADSVMNLGDRKVYIWALLREVNNVESSYYDEIDSDGETV